VGGAKEEKKKIEKFSVWGIKNHMSGAVRGGGARRVRPSPLDPLVVLDL